MLATSRRPTSVAWCRMLGLAHCSAVAATAATRPTLLVSFATDKASVTMARALLSSAGSWALADAHAEAGAARAGSALWRAVRDHGPPVYLWQLDDSPVHADHLDAEFAALDGCELPAEVLFLSRHVSIAGTASLCVHPVGNPRAELPADFGGRAGVCVPPAPRLAALYRLLCEEAKVEALARKASGSAEPFDFEPSFEATHHGPLLEQSPCAFLEIGSDESRWGRDDAGQLWARVLSRALGLGERAAEAPSWSELSDEQRAAATVVLVLGGGHYMSAAGDLARGSRSVYIGHMLASYSFDFRGDTDGPSWRSALDSAVAGTCAAYPGAGRIRALTAKKAFGAEKTSLLASHLELQHGIQLAASKAEMLKLLQ
ncbi:hypothetical protein T492DRAFT_1064666 [Pavlovales sp. CCMP2436]|nr:hypothetical protein T492DRAFT_1064666 [Pavlovales sp. CCMP2436]